MEKLRLDKKVKLWDCNGISIVGNPDNGAIIGLDKKGYNFVSDLKNEGVDKSLIIDDEERMIINELGNLGYFDEEISTVESAYLHVTDRCNLHCVGCYSYICNRNKQTDMTTEQIEYVLDELYSQGVKDLVISGGEPFLRNDINQILKKAKSLKMRICIITNGTLDYERYLPSLPYIDTLSISVDGYEKGKTFIRDDGATNRAIELVDKIKNNVNVHLIFTLHKKNVNYMKKYISLAEQLNVSFNFSIFTVNPSNPMFRDFLLGDEELNIIADSINEGDNIVIEDSVINGKSDGIEGLRCTTGCRLGCKMLSIAANGNVYPCHMLHNEDAYMGNVFEERLDIIIKDKKNIFRKLCVDDVSECNNCRHKYFCGGGCRGRSYLYNKNYVSKDPFCILTKKYLDERTEIFKMFK